MDAAAHFSDGPAITFLMNSVNAYILTISKYDAFYNHQNYRSIEYCVRLQGLLLLTAQRAVCET